MKEHATLKYLRISPQKVRLVADVIRGKSVEEALTTLQFLEKRSAKHLRKLLKGAVSNLDNKGTTAIDTFNITKITVDAGPHRKTFLPRAMGRATPIIKRTSHVFLEISND